MTTFQVVGFFACWAGLLGALAFGGDILDWLSKRLCDGRISWLYDGRTRSSVPRSYPMTVAQIEDGGWVREPHNDCATHLAYVQRYHCN